MRATYLNCTLCSVRRKRSASPILTWGMSTARTWRESCERGFSKAETRRIWQKGVLLGLLMLRHEQMRCREVCYVQSTVILLVSCCELKLPGQEQSLCLSNFAGVTSRAGCSRRYLDAGVLQVHSRGTAYLLYVAPAYLPYIEKRQTACGTGAPWTKRDVRMCDIRHRDQGLVTWPLQGLYRSLQGPYWSFPGAYKDSLCTECTSSLSTNVHWYFQQQPAGMLGRYWRLIGASQALWHSSAVARRGTPAENHLSTRRIPVAMAGNGCFWLAWACLCRAAHRNSSSSELLRPCSPPPGSPH